MDDFPKLNEHYNNTWMVPWVGCTDWSYDISPDGGNCLTLNMMQLYYAFSSSGRIFFCNDVANKAWDEIKYMTSDYPIRVFFINTNELTFYSDRETDYIFKVSDITTSHDLNRFALIGIVSIDYNGNSGISCSQFKPYIAYDTNTNNDYIMIGTVNNTGADVTEFIQIGCLFIDKRYKYIGSGDVVNSQLNTE